MTPIANAPQPQHILAFLRTSRQYLGLAEEKSAATPPPRHSVMTSTMQRTSMSTYRKLIHSFLLATGVAALAVGPAMADPGCGHMGGHSERHAQRLEQHHQQLHDALKLTAEQEPAWKKLMDSEKPRAAAQDGKPEDWAKLKAPERAEKMLELSKARQEQMAEHVAALKALYAVLTPEQQKTFEDFHAGHRRGMGGKTQNKS